MSDGFLGKLYIAHETGNIGMWYARYVQMKWIDILNIDGKEIIFNGQKYYLILNEQDCAEGFSAQSCFDFLT